MSTKVKNIVLTVLMAALFLGLFGWNILKEDSTYLYGERREPATFPELTLERVISGKFMEEFKDYTLDQFPMRDTFRSIKAVFSHYVFMNMDNNDVILEDGHISKLEYQLKDEMLDYAADRFGYIYKNMIEGTGSKVYLSVVPDKNLFLAEKGGYLSIDYNALASFMQERMDYAEYIDIMPLLSADDYYYTDSHWKQENIVDVAEHIATSMGVPFSDDFNVNTFETPFYGTYYGQAALPFIKPDTIKYLTNSAIENCTVTGVDGYGKDVPMQVYDTVRGSDKDPYEFFLSGNQPFITITNPENKSGKELVVFRDSFGSSLSPLLIQSYSKISVVDIRYLNPMALKSFVLWNKLSFENADVLFIYSSILLNSSITAGMK